MNTNGYPSILQKVGAQKIRLLGHVYRMDQKRHAKSMLLGRKRRKKQRKAKKNLGRSSDRGYQTTENSELETEETKQGELKKSGETN